MLNDEDDDDVDSDDGKPPRKISTRKPTLCPTRKWVITVRQMTKMRMTLMAGLAFAVDEGQTKMKVNSDMNQRSA